MSAELSYVQLKTANEARVSVSPTLSKLSVKPAVACRNLIRHLKFRKK